MPVLLTAIALVVLVALGSQAEHLSNKATTLREAEG